MAALNVLSLASLSTVDLKAVCESMGLSFAVIGECERLEVSGNLSTVDQSIKEAIKAHRDDLIALVWLVDMHGESFCEVPYGAHRQLNALIHELCDKAPYSQAAREAMIKASTTMRPMDIPHCIEHFRQCLEHVKSGTYWRFMGSNH